MAKEIIKPKNNSNNRTIWVSLTILFIISLGFIYFNSERLKTSPFESGLIPDEPSCVAINDAGYTVFIDSARTRVALVSPDKELITTIQYSAISSVSPEDTSCVAINDRYVYLLDQFDNNDGAGSRVLVYDLTGKYIETMAVLDSESEREIISLACDEESAYAICKAAQEDGSYRITINDITNHKFKKLASYNLEGVPFECRYQPSQDKLCIITYDGRLYCNLGKTQSSEEGSSNLLIEQSLDKKRQIDQFLFDEDSILFLDVNANEICQLKADGTVERIAKTGAEGFDLCQDMLVFADHTDKSIHWINLRTSDEEKLDNIPQSTRIRIMTIASWLAVTILVLILLFMMYRLVRWIIISARTNEKGTANVDPLTTRRLYGRIFLIMMMAFLVSSLMLGRLYYDNMMAKARGAVMEAAYSLSSTSRDNIGDDLAQINSQEDYGSESYDRLIRTLDYRLIKEANIPTKVDLSCSVYRFIDGEETVLLVDDPIDNNRIGTELNSKDQKIKQIDVGLNMNREGGFNQAVVRYNDKTVLYQIYAPVYDSQGNLVGSLVPMVNETALQYDIVMEIAVKLLEILTLLAGLSILIAELQFGRTVARIQKARRREGIFNKTLVEGDRSLQIILRMPTAIFIAFITLMTVTVLEQSGVNNSMMIALPFTLQSIIYAVGITVFAPIVKYNPRKNMKISMGVFIVAAGLFILANIESNYKCLIAATVFAAIAEAYSSASVNTIRMSGLMPMARYQLLIFANVEFSISSAIGVAIGSVIRGRFGDIGLMVFVILISLLAIPVINFVVGDDIRAELSDRASNAAERIEQRRKSITALKQIVCPKVVIMELLVLLPLGFLAVFQGYLLPLVNKYSGLPDVLIGTITLLIQLATLFAIPYVTKLIIKTGDTNTNAMAAIMGIIGVILVFFGINGEMRTFALALLAISIAKIVANQMADAVTVEKARETGVNANDISIFGQFIFEIGGFVGPAIITVMMVSGMDSTGFFWGAICAICAVLIYSINAD